MKFGTPLNDLTGDPCFKQIMFNGFSCVRESVPDFDLLKYSSDFGLQWVERRCCALSILSDCFNTIGKNECLAQLYDNMKWSLEKAKAYVNSTTCTQYPYKQENVHWYK
ncbi:unnamed protein product [Medioppia subpectinata]|uniref:Uncharacterized protein n=1 Tax=Medioppia subpectinata TaxID=1979941 RepID=A0A7R9L5H3_9ACAR|nr:unnamed protein product [Medioppia subpectinata]CAG2115708.1 unnamed protein product [Medioppia subpectinata]